VGNHQCQQQETSRVEWEQRYHHRVDLQWQKQVFNLSSRSMKTIRMPVEKTAIQELSGNELELLANFKKSKEYEIFQKLTDREKYLRYKEDILNAKSVENINLFKGINIGIDYILDSVNRAKEELQSRGAQVDNDDEIK
jgi:hypothetical protein